MTFASNQIIRFESYEIDVRRGELRNADQLVPVEPQVLDLLTYLASDPGRVFSRDEILEAVWGGRIVSDSAISTRINAARQAVGDNGKSQQIIRTVPRRGFMFVPETVVVEADGSAGRPNQSQSNEPALAPLGKPSIAVLPFENMSGDPEQAYFSDGITDDIIAELSRYDELFVIARQSSFIYRGRALDATEIGRELGVQYILDGSVRRAGNQIRIATQLIEAAAGNQIWAERYDRDMEDIFEVQDEITSVVANTLSAKLALRAYKRSLHKPPQALGAYDHALRANVLLNSLNPEKNNLARQEALRAVDIDPDFARGHALVAWTYTLESVLRWVDDTAESIRLGYLAAARAVELDDEEPWAYGALGFSQVWGKKQYESGMVAMNRAVALNPNNAHFRAWRSNALCFVGDSNAGMADIETAMRLNPHYPPLYNHFLARLLLTLRRYDEALGEIERVVAAQPSNTNAYAILAACYVGLGRIEEASNAIGMVLNLSPTFTLQDVPNATPYSQHNDREHYLSLLAKAGLPPK